MAFSRGACTFAVSATVLFATVAAFPCPYQPVGGGTTPEHCCNGVKDGDETDVDCGNSCTAAVPQYSCLTNERCESHSDCYSRICQEGTCRIPACEHCMENTEGECRQDLDGTCVPWVESFVASGGTACTPGSTPCIDGDDGEDCWYDSDCWSENCQQSCTGPQCCSSDTEECSCVGGGTCTDGILNRYETDVDCGGSECPGCDIDEDCLIDSDCLSDVCANGTGDEWVCVCDGDDDCPEGDCDGDGNCSTCSDGLQNGSEEGTDCGGPHCPACPSCSDSIQNQDETDVDCGGDVCPGCAIDEDCLDDDDCLSGYCDSATDSCGCDGTDDCPAGQECNSDGDCYTPSCNDGIKNQDETDVDCGGDVCPGCEAGEDCEEDDDCQSGICDTAGDDTCSCDGDEDCPQGEQCDENGDCYGDTCSDNEMNQDETDVDCGGDVCPGCLYEEDCIDNGDCLSNLCDTTGDNTCMCSSDTHCPPGQECNPNGDCNVPTCTDGIQNQDETDVDCGGSVCDGCFIDDLCTQNEDCQSTVCENDGFCHCSTSADCPSGDECVEGDCVPVLVTTCPPEFVPPYPHFTGTDDLEEDALLRLQLNAPGVVYWVVLTDGATPPPTSAQVKAGVDGNGEAPIAAGATAVGRTHVTYGAVVSGFILTGSYDVYLATECAETANVEGSGGVLSPRPTQISVDGQSGGYWWWALVAFFILLFCCLLCLCAWCFVSGFCAGGGCVALCPCCAGVKPQRSSVAYMAAAPVMMAPVCIPAGQCGCHGHGGPCTCQKAAGGAASTSDKASGTDAKGKAGKPPKGGKLARGRPVRTVG